MSLLITAVIWASCTLTILVRHLKRKTFFTSFLQLQGGIESQEPLDKIDKLLALISLVTFIAMLYQMM